MTTISLTAESAREAARASDGRFSTQPRSAPEVAILGGTSLDSTGTDPSEAELRLLALDDDVDEIIELSGVEEPTEQNRRLARLLLGQEASELTDSAAAEILACAGAHQTHVTCSEGAFAAPELSEPYASRLTAALEQGSRFVSYPGALDGVLPAGEDRYLIRPAALNNRAPDTVSGY